jgi:hypothetical protein
MDFDVGFTWHLTVRLEINKFRLPRTRFMWIMQRRLSQCDEIGFTLETDDRIAKGS